jgi:CubicO group peptidase (beta-lactamase class C family)
MSLKKVRPMTADQADTDFMQLMQGFPPAKKYQVLLANWREPGIARWAFNHLRQLLPTSPMAAAEQPIAIPEARLDLGSLSFQGPDGKCQQLDRFLRSIETDCFAVMKDGKLVYDWFGGFGGPTRQHIVFSVTKSMAALLAGVLVGQGRLDPSGLITRYLPELENSAYNGASVRNLLDMQVASGFNEDYLDTTGIFMAYRRAAAWNPVEEGVRNDGLRAFLTRLPISDGRHGEKHHYCSPHSDVLGWLLERVGGASFSDLFSRYILQPCGTRHEAYITLDTFGAPRVSGGLCITVHDLLLIGNMVCNGGVLDGAEIVPASWIDDILQKRDNLIWLGQNSGEGPRLFTNGNYRSKWYQPDQKCGVICGIGIHGQWFWIDPDKRLVIAKMASRGMVVDTDTDRQLLAAFAAITNCLRH